MPNWIENRISGDSKILRSFLTEDWMDFNNVIPMPKSLFIDESTELYRALFIFLTNKTFDERVLKENPAIKDLTETEVNKIIAANINLKEKYTALKIDKLYAYGEKAYNNKKEHGYFTWYDWRLDNWGTKWNADETVCVDIPGGYLSISFRTPWTPPFYVFEAICKKYPDIEFKFYWEDVQEQTYTVGRNINGELDTVTVAM